MTGFTAHSDIARAAVIAVNVPISVFAWALSSGNCSGPLCPQVAISAHSAITIVHDIDINYPTDVLNLDLHLSSGVTIQPEPALELDSAQ
jgi:hypothetical protein